MPALQRRRKIQQYFSKFGKSARFPGKVGKLVSSKHKITDSRKIELLEKNIKKTLSEQTNFSDTLQIPKLSDNGSLLCERELTDSEPFDALKNMPNNNKSPENNGLIKQFHLSFWGDIKDKYIGSIWTTGIKKLNVLQ